VKSGESSSLTVQDGAPKLVAPPLVCVLKPRKISTGNAMSLFNAYQIEVTSSDPAERQVFFVAAASQEEAMAALAGNGDLLPQPVLNLQRRLSGSEIDMH